MIKNIYLMKHIFLIMIKKKVDQNFFDHDTEKNVDKNIFDHDQKFRLTQFKFN